MLSRKQLLLVVIYLLLLSLPVTFTVFAAEAGKGTKAASKAKTGTWDTKPFDVSVQRLPKGYIGHSIKATYEKVSKMILKDEFETTAAYIERMLRRSLGLYAFAFKPEANYDVDSQTMRINFASRPLRETLRVKTGSSAGVSGTVVHYRGEEYYANFEDIHLSHNLQMDPGYAKKSKGSLMAMAIGEPTRVDFGETFIDATFEYPFTVFLHDKHVYLKLCEVWIYNLNTGEILYRDVKFTEQKKE